MDKSAKDAKVKKIKVVSFNKGSVDFSKLPACSDMGSLNVPVMVD